LTNIATKSASVTEETLAAMRMEQRSLASKLALPRTDGTISLLLTAAALTLKLQRENSSGNAARSLISGKTTNAKSSAARERNGTEMNALPRTERATTALTLVLSNLRFQNLDLKVTLMKKMNPALVPTGLMKHGLWKSAVMIHSTLTPLTPTGTRNAILSLHVILTWNAVIQMAASLSL